MKLLRRYKDEDLVRQAEKALFDDPTIDATRLEVTCENGIVTIAGTLRGTQDREHMIDIVRRALGRTGLKYERIVDAVNRA